MITVATYSLNIAHPCRVLLEKDKEGLDRVIWRGEHQAIVIDQQKQISRGIGSGDMVDSGLEGSRVMCKDIQSGRDHVEIHANDNESIRKVVA